MSDGNGENGNVMVNGTVGDEPMVQVNEPMDEAEVQANRAHEVECEAAEYESYMHEEQENGELRKMLKEWREMKLWLQVEGLKLQDLRGMGEVLRWLREHKGELEEIAGFYSLGQLVIKDE